MNWKPLIEIDPAGGSPRLRGSTLTVKEALELQADGESLDSIRAIHPQVTMEHIRAAQAYAASKLAERTSPTIEQVDRAVFELTTKASAAKWVLVTCGVKLPEKAEAFYIAIPDNSR